MSKRSKILDLLKENELTTKEIQNKTNYDIKIIWTYISQFTNEGKIKKVGNKKRFPIYTAIKKENMGVDNDLVDKLVLLMIKTEINSEKYGINIYENEIEPSIKRLTKGGLIG